MRNNISIKNSTSSLSAYSILFTRPLSIVLISELFFLWAFKTDPTFGQKGSSTTSKACYLHTHTAKRETHYYIPLEEMSKKQMVKLDEEQIAELREIFRSFDRNNDGSLTQLELSSLLRSLGLKPSAEQLEGFIQRADTNNNGMVEFSEFVALVAPDLLPAKSHYTEDQLRHLFRMFDRDGNGLITAAELAHSMARLGHALTVEELTGMIKEADTDGDGMINFQEFAHAITSAAWP